MVTLLNGTESIWNLSQAAGGIVCNISAGSLMSLGQVELSMFSTGRRAKGCLCFLSNGTNEGIRFKLNGGESGKMTRDSL